MSSKDRYGKFKKKHYVRTIYAVRDYLCRQFGYKIKPFLFETELPPRVLMNFCHNANGWAIFYDYKKFKKRFGHEDFEGQEAYAAASMAHEMRHYYQHRQMLAPNPKESEKTIMLWWDNEENTKSLEDGDSLLDCLLQPLELDARLFEYVFAAEEFDLLLPRLILNEEHFNAMEKLYVEYYGKTDESLFNDEIRERLK